MPPKNWAESDKSEKLDDNITKSSNAIEHDPEIHRLIETVIDHIKTVFNNQWNQNELDIDPDTYDLFQLLWKEYLRKLVIEEYKKWKAFTAWQEWEVYQIDLRFKKFLLLKRRLTAWAKNEFDLHKIAFDISKKSKSWVKVPVPMDCFVEWNDELILMEFINWKTLYNLVWQSIVEDVLIKEVQKNINRTNNNRLQSKLDEYKSTHIQNWKINFENDTICEEWVLEILFMMYESWIIKENPWTIAHVRWKKVYTVLEDVYKKNFEKVNIFKNVEQKKAVTNSLRIFLNEMHKEWFYHRDLWWNPRNIILEFKWDNIDTTVIDFGKSEKLSPWAKSLYFDELYWADFDKDNEIISMINNIWSSIQTQEINNETPDDKGIEKLISKAKKAWLDISEDYITENLNFIKKRNLTIKKYFQELLDWKNINKWNHIFLKTKMNDFEEKSTSKSKIDLFITIFTLTNEEKQNLKDYLQQFLWGSKNTNKYKYAKLFMDYLELLK